MAAFLKNFFVEKSPDVLLVLKNGNKNVFLAAKNMPNVKAINANSLNVYDCLNYKKIFIEKEALEEIIAREGK